MARENYEPPPTTSITHGIWFFILIAFAVFGAWTLFEITYAYMAQNFAFRGGL